MKVLKVLFVDDFSATGSQTFSQGTESYWPSIFSNKPTDSDFPQCYRFNWKQEKEDQYKGFFSGQMAHFEEVVGVDEVWTQNSEAGKAGMLALCANESRENPTT